MTMEEEMLSALQDIKQLLQELIEIEKRPNEYKKAIYNYEEDRKRWDLQQEVAKLKKKK